MTLVKENFRTLYVDPGETTGWCVGSGTTLLGGGQTPMWEFIDDVWAVVCSSDAESLGELDKPWLRKEIAHRDNVGPIKRIVAEDWRLYPNKLKALAWDQCRTARALGALKFICRISDIEFVLQPAAIKQRAQIGGAEELYCKPAHENRHQNDSIQHFVFYTQTELMGVTYTGLDDLPGKPEAD